MGKVMGKILVLGPPHSQSRKTAPRSALGSGGSLYAPPKPGQDRAHAAADPVPVFTAYWGRYTSLRCWTVAILTRRSCSSIS